MSQEPLLTRPSVGHTFLVKIYGAEQITPVILMVNYVLSDNCAGRWRRGTAKQQPCWKRSGQSYPMWRLKWSEREPKDRYGLVQKKKFTNKRAIDDYSF